MLADGKKTAEAIALQFATSPKDKPVGQNEVLCLQNFLTDAPWEAADVQREIQAVFAEELVPAAAKWPIGVVGVFDGSSFVKRGSESVGVKRQWCGRLGKIENCQVGEFLIGVTPDGSAALDQAIYLPRAWAANKSQRRKTRVPKIVKYRSQRAIALDLLRSVLGNGHVQFDWVTADAHYGDDGDFLNGLESLQQRYLLEIHAEKTFWTVDPQEEIPPYGGRGRYPTRARRDHVQSAQAIAAQLPPEQWQSLKLREGAKGPLVFEFARVRLWSVRHRERGPATWLLLRRSLDAKELKYYVSNADEQTPLENMALVSGTRWRVEEYFEEAKGELGMADYEARAWTSWHHHMSLVALAHLFVTLTRRDVNEDFPELTLPLAIRLLKSAMSRPTLTERDALRLTEYHLERNATARASHHKSWHHKHKKLKQKPLL
jgi:SRSO17 transposase